MRITREATTKLVPEHDQPFHRHLGCHLEKNQLGAAYGEALGHFYEGMRGQRLRAAVDDISRAFHTQPRCLVWDCDADG